MSGDLAEALAALTPPVVVAVAFILIVRSVRRIDAAEEARERVRDRTDAPGGEDLAEAPGPPVGPPHAEPPPRPAADRPPSGPTVASGDQPWPIGRG